MQILSQNSVKLCPCNQSGCPTIEKNGEDIKITDDYGDSVKMTLEEAKEMVEALAYLETV
jgi:hypothetical protein